MNYLNREIKIAKIVSGGQTGGDRGGLNAAIELKLPHGGWCPKGRIAEDDTVPDQYKLTECGAKAYIKRTELNVKDSDATLIFTPGKPTGGSKKTAQFAKKHDKPCLVIDSLNEESATVAEIITWLQNLQNSHKENSIKMGACTLNVAGSRGSKSPKLQEYVKNVMISVINAVNNIEEFAEKSVADQTELIALPFYPELEIACGAFRDGVSEYEAGAIEIQNPHKKLDLEKHFIVRASGDSMDGGRSPIKNGELLLELNTGGTISNQIFAIEYRDNSGALSYILKRIKKQSDGSYVLISHNRAYPPIPVDPESMFPFARLKKIVQQDDR